MPAATPFAMPEVRPMVATAVLPLVQVPPPLFVSVDEPPIHTAAVPDIAEGNGRIVATAVVIQPVVVSL